MFSTVYMSLNRNKSDVLKRGADDGERGREGRIQFFGSIAPETERRESRRLDVSKADLQVV
jgi:hypothetical protein